MLFSMLDTDFVIDDTFSCKKPSSWTYPASKYSPSKVFQHAHDPLKQVTWVPVDWRTVNEACSAYGQMMGTCTVEPYPTTWVA